MTMHSLFAWVKHSKQRTMLGCFRAIKSWGLHFGQITLMTICLFNLVDVEVNQPACRISTESWPVLPVSKIHVPKQASCWYRFLWWRSSFHLSCSEQGLRNRNSLCPGLSRGYRHPSERNPLAWDLYPRPTKKEKKQCGGLRNEKVWASLHGEWIGAVHEFRPTFNFIYLIAV